MDKPQDDDVDLVENIISHNIFKKKRKKRRKKRPMDKPQDDDVDLVETIISSNIFKEKKKKKKIRPMDKLQDDDVVLVETIISSNIFKEKKKKKKKRLDKPQKDDTNFVENTISFNTFKEKNNKKPMDKPQDGSYSERWRKELEKKKKKPVNQPISKSQDREHVTGSPCKTKELEKKKKKPVNQPISKSQDRELVTGSPCKTIKLNEIKKELQVLISSTKLSEECKRETQKVQLSHDVASVADWSCGCKSVSQTLNYEDTLYGEYNANTHWRSLGMVCKGGFYFKKETRKVQLSHDVASVADLSCGSKSVSQTLKDGDTLYGEYNANTHRFENEIKKRIRKLVKKANAIMFVRKCFVSCLQQSTALVQYFDSLLEIIIVNNKFFIEEARLQGFIINFVEYTCHLCKLKVSINLDVTKLLLIIRKHVGKCQMKFRQEKQHIDTFFDDYCCLLKLNKLVKEFFQSLQIREEGLYLVQCNICNSAVQLKKSKEKCVQNALTHIKNNHKCSKNSFDLQQILDVFLKLQNIRWCQSNFLLQRECMPDNFSPFSFNNSLVGYRNYLISHLHTGRTSSHDIDFENFCKIYNILNEANYSSYDIIKILMSTSSKHTGPEDKTETPEDEWFELTAASGSVFSHLKLERVFKELTDSESDVKVPESWEDIVL